MATFNIKSSDSAITARLQTLYNNSKLCDIVVKPDGSLSTKDVSKDASFFACKAILASASPVFARLLYQPRPPGRPDAMDIVGREFQVPADALILEAVLKYLHGFEIFLPFEHLWPLLSFVTAYQIQELVDKVETLLDRSVTASTCMSLLWQAQISGSHDHPVMKRALLVALSEFCEVCKTQGFLESDFAIVSSLLLSDDLNATEETVFEAAMSWLEYDEKRCSTYIDRVIMMIRFPLLTPNLVASLETHRTASKCTLLPGIILKTLKYHLAPATSLVGPKITNEAIFKQRKGGMYWRLTRTDTCVSAGSSSFVTHTLSSSTDLIEHKWSLHYELFSGNCDIVFGLVSLKDHPTDQYVGRFSSGFGISIKNGNFYQGKCKCEESVKELCTPVCPSFLSFSSPRGSIDLWIDPKTTDLTIRTDRGATFMRRLFVTDDKPNRFFPAVSLLNAKARIMLIK